MRNSCGRFSAHNMPSVIKLRSRRDRMPRVQRLAYANSSLSRRIGALKSFVESSRRATYGAPRTSVMTSRPCSRRARCASSELAAMVRSPLAGTVGGRRVDALGGSDRGRVNHLGPARHVLHDRELALVLLAGV